MQRPHPAYPSVAERSTPRGGVLLTPGQRLRAIVKKAVDQRRFLLSTGRSHKTLEQVRMPLMRLEVWLQRYPHGPIAANVKAFPHEDDVHQVIPGPRGSSKALAELRQLLRD